MINMYIWENIVEWILQDKSMQRRQQQHLTATTKRE